jgi:hypothetical protein
MFKNIDIFLIRSLIVICVIFILYHLTIGPEINKITKLISDVENYKKEFKNVTTRERLRAETVKLIEKDRIIYKEDALIIRKLLDKLKNEIYPN